MIRSILRLSVFVLPALLAVGCGGTSQVSGTVSYNGKPVKTGSVTFRAPDGSVYAGTITDGNYSVDGVPSGPVKVAVASPDPTTAPPAAQSGGGRNSPPAAPPKTPPKKPDGWFPLPARFSDPDASGAATTLKPGANTFPIELKD